jgi:hypothetical protein
MNARTARTEALADILAAQYVLAISLILMAVVLVAAAAL